jgi:translation elongation factor EF-1alpha
VQADSAVLVVAANVDMEDPNDDAARVLMTQATVLKCAPHFPFVISIVVIINWWVRVDRALEIEDIVVCVTKLDLVAGEGRGDHCQQQAFERTKRFVLNLLTKHSSLGFHPYTHTHHPLVIIMAHRT